VVEGAPDNLVTGGGHGAYCLGPSFNRCHPLTGPVSTGSSALAVADVNHDHYDDIIQGDHVVEPAAFGSAAAGGEVRLWFGGRHGVRDEPLIIDQDTPGVPDADEAGDDFGMSVSAGRLDDDGYADIAVSAPGEDGGKGAVTILRGGKHGLARAAHTRFVPGNGFPAGATGIGLVSVMDVTGDARPDLIVTAAGGHDLQHAIYVLAHRKGAFAPGEVRIWRPLRRKVHVPGAQIDDIRIAREAGA
jgi:hypothetical protein